MSLPSQRKIKELLTSKEKSRVDYKGSYHLRSNNDKNELAKDVCTIANFLHQANGKGYLIIGADDNGVPIGVKHSDYAETRLQQIIVTRSDPPPIFHVHHASYLGFDLVIIEIRRHASGPHQVINGINSLGFPTRRGSTTGAMTTIEVFQAMQIRGRSFVRSPSEYRTLSPNAAKQKIKNDIREALIEIGTSPNSIQNIHIETTRDRFGGDFLRIIKVINNRRWIFYIRWSFSDESMDSMFFVEDTIIGLSNKIPMHRTIFVHLVNGKISNSYFTKRQKSFNKHVKVQIEPNITYFGLGQGAELHTSFKHLFVPKFFASNIKSRDDIKMRLALIFNWVNQNHILFEDIRLALT